MTDVSLCVIDVLRVARVQRPERGGQRVLRARRDHQVDVIGHQAIRVDCQAMPDAVSAQQLKEAQTILIAEEHVFLAIAPLSYVQRHVRNDHPGYPRHAGIVSAYQSMSRPKIGLRP